MAIESVSTSLEQNVISDTEMRRACDESVSASPERFLPYRKLLGAIGGASAAFDSRQDELKRLRTLLAVIADGDSCSPEFVPDLARIAEDMTAALLRHSCEMSECLGGILESARATVPRNRWEDSGAPDDRADSDDLAREAAAAVPTSGAQ